MYMSRYVNRGAPNPDNKIYSAFLLQQTTKMTTQPEPKAQPEQQTLAAACAARAQQVEWMVAAAPSARTVRRVPWPAPSAQTREARTNVAARSAAVPDEDRAVDAERVLPRTSSTTLCFLGNEGSLSHR
jgi:hypothetical protein